MTNTQKKINMKISRNVRLLIFVIINSQKIMLHIYIYIKEYNT